MHDTDFCYCNSGKLYKDCCKIREIYKPKNTWHLEKDSGKDIKHFDGERWVFGIQNDYDDGEYCKSMLAPDSLRQKYVGKKLPEYYCWTQGQQNPVKYSF